MLAVVIIYFSFIVLALSYKYNNPYYGIFSVLNVYAYIWIVF